MSVYRVDYGACYSLGLIKNFRRKNVARKCLAARVNVFIKRSELISNENEIRFGRVERSKTASLLKTKKLYSFRKSVREHNRTKVRR